jgi:sulfoxide reductase catalytic subunit YedY
MPTRRDILKIFIRFFLWTVTTIGLGLSSGKDVFAQIKKRILPKDTDPKSLRDENPEFLDTRNLQVMPLEAFGTMGDKDVSFNPTIWRLEVTGAVRKSLKFTYTELLTLPSIEREVLLVCPGFFANHGRWKGISIRDLMKRAGSTKNTSKVIIYGRSRSGDRKEHFKIEEVKADQIFLAYAVNGQTLPKKHGLPLRVVAKGHWGSEWVKYVYKVEFA